jgi:hypothetical protein
LGGETPASEATGTTHRFYSREGEPHGPVSAIFSTISRTRLPTGDAGSSRQIQFALKLIF